MPASPSAAGSGWSFTFPNTSGPSGGVHYLVTQSPNLASKSTLAMSGVISVAPGTAWGSNDPSDITPDHCRAYFQQAGDDLSGTGPHEFYRWFSHTAITLTDGSFNVTIPFDPPQWGSVLGKDGKRREAVGLMLALTRSGLELPVAAPTSPVTELTSKAAPPHSR